MRYRINPIYFHPFVDGESDLKMENKNSKTHQAAKLGKARIKGHRAGRLNSLNEPD
jgi:hypothetical protein